MTTDPRSFSLLFPRAHGAPLGTGKIRVEPEDFQVDEILGFEPSGSGEHHVVQLQKKGCNTEWLARQIAGFCKVKTLDVGYCGLKDRQALTTQWFSVYAPKTPAFAWPELVAQLPDPVTLLACGKHHKKLKRGEHAANRFELLIRDFAADPAAVESRLHRLGSAGVPNYFGVQRFGSNGNNLHAAEAWANNVRLDRRRKTFAMSAARSYLFNKVLATRVTAGSWHSLIAGDVPIEGMPSGPLWGRGRTSTADAARALEQEALEGFESWQAALEHCGLMQARRSFVARPQNLTYSLQSDALQLAFTLGAGEFATSVLQELIEVESPA